VLQKDRAVTVLTTYTVLRLRDAERRHSEDSAESGDEVESEAHAMILHIAGGNARLASSDDGGRDAKRSDKAPGDLRLLASHCCMCPSNDALG